MCPHAYEHHFTHVHAHPFAPTGTAQFNVLNDAAKHYEPTHRCALTHNDAYTEVKKTWHSKTAVKLNRWLRCVQIYKKRISKYA